MGINRSRSCSSALFDRRSLSDESVASAEPQGGELVGPMADESWGRQ